MSIGELLEKHTSSELSEWMAYDLVSSKEWQEKRAKQKKLEASAKMSDEEKSNMFKQMLGVK